MHIMNPESSYVVGQWYCPRNGRMVPCMGQDELAKREQLLAEIDARQVQTRRHGLRVVV